MTGETTAILAAHLGIGDVLPDELHQLLDKTFQENYDEKFRRGGRHATVVPFHMNGDEVFQGKAMEGAAAEVIVTATSREGRFSEVLGLYDLWKLPAADVSLELVEPAVRATAVFGIAESLDLDGDRWISAVWDQRGAPVALLNNRVFAELISGREGRRVEQVRAVDRSLTLENGRAAAASAAADYLAIQMEEPSDGGQRPLWWQVLRVRGITVVERYGPALLGHGEHRRRHKLSTKVVSEITRDATGRAKPGATGSSWRWQTPGRVGELPQARGEVAWAEVDPTGETATALADRTLIRRLEGAGLTARQVLILAKRADGCSRQEIADDLGISVRTVDRHLAETTKRLKSAV